MNPFKRIASAFRKIYDKAFGLVKDPARSFRDRVFILLTIVTDLVIILALVGDILNHKSIVEIIAIVWAFQGKSKDLPIIKGIGFLK